MTLYTQKVIASIPDVVESFKKGNTITSVSEQFNIPVAIVESIIRVALRLQPIYEIESEILGEEYPNSTDAVEEG